MLSPLFYLLLPLAILGYRKLFPNGQTAIYLGHNQQAFKKYRRWDKTSGWLMLLFFIISMLIICGPLYSYRNYNEVQHNRARFIVLPDRFDWVIITWLGLFGLSPLLVLIVGSKLYLGDDFRGYVDYTNWKSKYNAFKAIVPLCGGIAAFGITLFTLLWNYGLFAYCDRIVVHWFLSTNAKVYPYDQVKSIVFTPETTKQGASYTVTFKDGMDWNTLTGLRDPESTAHINFISKQSGVKIDTIQAIHN